MATTTHPKADRPPIHKNRLAASPKTASIPPGANAMNHTHLADMRGTTGANPDDLRRFGSWRASHATAPRLITSAMTVIRSRQKYR
ncbi:hypothetical protein [Roseobacter weihaiensis]|uniref:hypothetical protein n=1 Tax=Roseobacter weihaiensis TaxID=2763262 RepID=UPI001D0BC83C|nr:hypothetical protein [Roseobacter sp. H9]